MPPPSLIDATYEKALPNVAVENEPENGYDDTVFEDEIDFVCDDEPENINIRFVSDFELIT